MKAGEITRRKSLGIVSRGGNIELSSHLDFASSYLRRNCARVVRRTRLEPHQLPASCIMGLGLRKGKKRERGRVTVLVPNKFITATRRRKFVL